MPNKIGIGFIGSRFAADLHAHALGKLRGVTCEILAVCSKTKESAEAFARKFNIPHVYTDHRAMLERKDIHLVTLPVVTSLHHTLAIDAANAGKHIVVEKPLTGCFVAADAMTRQAMFAEAMKNADEVVEACRRNTVTMGYAENFVYAPPMAKLRRLMNAGGGGRSSTFGPRRATPAPTRRTPGAGPRRAGAPCCGWGRTPSGRSFTSSTTRA
jgi:predicted dehydrogenase